jgi:energy-converting hydrogenase Eha subunit E
MSRLKTALQRPVVGSLIVLLIGALAAALLLYATPWGLGLGGDSYYYVSGAQSLLAGQGFSHPTAGGSTRPITHFPPLYPALLAAVASLGSNVLDAARITHALLFAANVLASACFLWTATGRRMWAAVGISLIALSPAGLSVHSWLLSEPMFIVAVLLGLWSVMRFILTGSRTMLVAAGIWAGLAALVRYAGIGLLGGMALAVLVHKDSRGRAKLTDIGLLVSVGLAGPALWGLRNVILTGASTNRSLSLHVPTMDKLNEGLTTIGGWLIPFHFGEVLALAAAIGVMAATTLGAMSLLVSRGAPRAAKPVRAAILVTLSFLIAYLTVLSASLSLADASTPLDSRILLPVFVVGVILIVCILHGFSPGLAGRWLFRAILILALVAASALALKRDLSSIADSRAFGLGFASPDWRHSQIIRWIDALDPAVPLYSNEVDAVYLLTGRQAFQVPIRWDPVRAAPREDYEQQLAAMRERIADQGAALVLFDTLAEQQGALPSEAELAEGLQTAFRAADGVVYVDGR